MPQERIVVEVGSLSEMCAVLRSVVGTEFSDWEFWPKSPRNYGKVCVLTVPSRMSIAHQATLFAPEREEVPD